MLTNFAGRTNRRAITSGDTLLERLRSEIRHAPAIALTLPQAARLFNLEEETCERLIAALAEEGYVHVRADGRFVSTRA